MFSYIQNDSGAGYEWSFVSRKQGSEKIRSQYLKFASYIFSCTQQYNIHSTSEPYFYEISKIVGVLS